MLIHEARKRPRREVRTFATTTRALGSRRLELLVSRLVGRGKFAGGPPRVPTSPRLEELKAAWFDAGDLATRQRIAAEIQVQALSDVTAIPLGLFYDRTGVPVRVDGTPGRLACVLECSQTRVMREREGRI